MKLLSFTHKGRESWGAQIGEGAGAAIIDLGKETAYPTLQAFIASPDYARREEVIKGKQATIPLGQIKYLPVIPKAEKIILLVRNYLDHHQEVVAAGLQRELSAHPPIFMRYWQSQIGHNEPIIRPKCSVELDWEGEMAVIIGKGGRHIPESEAMSHIAGYALYNDASIREYQFHAKQIAAGKNFVGTGPFGPYMVTPDELGDPNNLKLEVRLNGKVMQSSNTSMLIFKIPTLINYCSTIWNLEPGDVIVTGTPGGVGWSRKPPVFMKHGDVCEVEIEKLGILRNPIVDEA
jgi:2-keto-4-pentenoate hydratase/2-oxohepta-3-ene-1,7-dioic acid hydratase in catechol pathway